MANLRFSAKKTRDVAEWQSSTFWQSPWSVVSEWWDPNDPENATARVYRDGRRVIVEIDIANKSAEETELEVDSNHLYLRYPKGQATIPLPFFVDQSSANATWDRGALRVEMDQASSQGRAERG